MNFWFKSVAGLSMIIGAIAVVMLALWAGQNGVTLDDYILYALTIVVLYLGFKYTKPASRKIQT